MRGLVRPRRVHALPARDRKPQKPHLVIAGDDAPALADAALAAAAPVWRLHVAGAQHLDHTDLSLLLPSLPLLGKIGGARMHAIVVRAVDAVVERIARGKAAADPAAGADPGGQGGPLGRRSKVSGERRAASGAR